MTVTDPLWQAIELAQTSAGMVIVRAPTHTVIAHDITANLDPDLFHMNGGHFALHATNGSVSYRITELTPTAAHAVKEYDDLT